uniref:Cell division protein ZipA n=1 Tax=Candidatus Kentrum eta TaxID=2126337 RepID=A0A450VBB0_9GAMM|nr:MAG: cell division protein ZipA [Candidatus Kentron sp. H]VFK02332.1 MAG: cell division protein ZipA [Candidatus Kentron sp. H]VFK05356.1 MAG: cell division protein ZipA [Candidatus Kentron sp. H]
MDNLRLILFISGILLIAAIYAWEIFRERRANAQRPDIFDDDALLQQNNPGDEHHADTDRDYSLDRHSSDRTEIRDKVVLGDLDALDKNDARNEPSATVSDDAQTTPIERAPVEMTGTAEEAAVLKVTAKDITDPEPSAGADILAPSAEKSRAGKGQSDKGRAGKGRLGRTTGKSARAEKLVIALTIMAKAGRRFMGPAIHEQFESAGMHFGEMRIFHHFGIDVQQTDQPIFSAADILEPGTFSLDNLENRTTSGLVLFMQLPGPLDGLVAFDLMLNAAQKLAKSLDGELCDDTRSTLTTQAANHLRERIEEMKRKQLV